MIQNRAEFQLWYIFKCQRLWNGTSHHCDDSRTLVMISLQCVGVHIAPIDRLSLSFFSKMATSAFKSGQQQGEVKTL